MSLFISGLGFKDYQLLDQSKLGILFGSALAAVAGLIFLRVLPTRDQ